MDQSLPADPHAEIRAEVAKLCAHFPGEYWRRLDRDRIYPTEFVRALTEAGYLAALIPEEYGGSGLTLIEAAAILEEIHACGGNGAASIRLRPLPPYSSGISAARKPASVSALTKAVG